MKKAAVTITGACAAVLLLAPGGAIVADFEGLAGKPVPDNYGGLNWVDPFLGNLWVVDPSYPPLNPTPCALFDSGDTVVEATISSASPIDFVSIDFAGLPGDRVQLFAYGPSGEYASGRIDLDGISVLRYLAGWLEITSLTIYFDSLFPGSTTIDNLTFEPSMERWLATIFRENFDSFTSDQELLDAGWEVRHGQYPATDGGIWHIADTGLEDGGVLGVYVISDSDAEGELPPSHYIDERLISPEIDCTEFTEVHLEFRHNLKVYPEEVPDEVFNVHVSSDPAHTNWQSNKVPYWSEADGNSVYPQSVDISSFADGKKIRIRWRYTANFDYWWAIDDVRIVGRPNVLEVTSVQVDPESGEVSIAWEAPDGHFAIEASDDSAFSEVTELAAGISEKQWTGTDPEASDGQRFYRVRMD